MIQSFLSYAEQHPEVLSAVSAALATFVAFCSIALSAYSLWVQRRHNRASVRPIAFVGYWDKDAELVVRVRNAGVGPMTIKSLIVESLTDGFQSKTVSEQIRRKGFQYKYTHVATNSDGRVLRPSGSVTLLKLKGDPEDAEYRDRRDNVRRVLSELKVTLTFLDIYEREVGTVERSLKFFGRHFEERQEDTEDSGLEDDDQGTGQTDKA